MMLQNRNAVLYGVKDSLGLAVARAFAREGARVFLTGRDSGALEKAATGIRADGGQADTAIVDAMKADEVNAHIEDMLGKAGTIDISFNLIGLQDAQNIPLVDMELEDFVRPVNIAMHTQFLTTTAAGRVMMKQGSGVILSLTATPGGVAYPLVGGFGPACCAIEGYSRDLASELGPYGVRVLNIRSAGSPDSRPFREALAAVPDFAETFITELEEDTMLKKLPMMADIANVASFLASDLAGPLTGVTIDVTAGTANGLNYKAKAIPLQRR